METIDYHVSYGAVLPLSGVTVVALEQAVAAPFATRHLADLGARVIKIERPDGGDFARAYDTKVKGLSSHFVWLNRSKESMTLDLKHPAAGDVLHRLLAKADVFVQNLAPGAAERLGAAPATLRARYPRLIVCGVSGYGTAGPYKSRKAYDLLVQSETGLISITGPEDMPSRVGISAADLAAGMYAFSGVLAALLARHQTGAGTTIDVSLFDALGEWMSAATYFTTYGGSPPPRSGPYHSSIAPYGPFAGADGRPVYLAVQNAREWERFCADVLRRPALSGDERFSTNERRLLNRDALHEVIRGALSELSSEAIAGRLETAGIAYARMNSVAEFAAHAQLSARDRWREIDSEAGPLRALLPPLSMDDVDPVMGPVPALGEHTAAVLEELGFDPGSIARLKTAGAI